MNEPNIQKEIKIHVPLNNNKLLEETVKRVNENEELVALWKVMNINALERLSMSDHGIVHFQIVANISLRIARILKKKEIVMSSVSQLGLTDEHAEVILFLASIMHDLGMSISRDGHEEFSLFLANNLMHEILSFLPVSERTMVISEVLHAIISHRKNGVPYTIEAGIVRVADALDMSEGRSRIPYLAGKIDIYSVSAAAIDNLEISEGETCPVKIVINMNNSAGIFQIDELLKSKIKGSNIEKYIEIEAYIKEENERKLIKEYFIKSS